MIVSKAKLKKFQEFNITTKDRYKNRIIGKGSVGGKAKGLFFAKELLDEHWVNGEVKIVVPESYFVSTEVFDDFIETNNLASVIREAESGKATQETVEKAFLEGDFHSRWKQEFRKLLSKIHYPLAIRSSSVLEDSIKYAFAGKYLTTYVANKGSLDQRLAALEEAIKRVYASTYGPNAVIYRKKHRLKGEKMAIIIQKLMGKERNGCFYPELAGVGYSRNYRRWTERIKTEDGVIRLVFGLGTRCTERGYARIFSLTNPLLRPEGNNNWEIAKYSQESVDAIDMETGKVVSFNINKKLSILKNHRLFRDYVQLYSVLQDQIKGITLLPSKLNRGEKVIFSFTPFDKKYKKFFQLIRRLFQLLEKEMGIAVDIEFTYEPEDDVFGLIQARPLSSWEHYRKIPWPQNVLPQNILLKGDRMLTHGYVENIPYMVYVDHDKYYATANKHEVARAIGEINNRLSDTPFVLVGPGRWGSSNPHLGIPVNYSEISNCKVLIELGIKKQNFVPELSYGTHFFADLELEKVLYMPVFDTIETNIINFEWFNSTPFKKTRHPAIRIYKGPFHVYLDGHEVKGIVLKA